MRAGTPPGVIPGGARPGPPPDRPSRPAEGDVLVLVVEVLAAVGVLFAVAVLVTGRAGAMTGAAPDRAPVELPEDRALTGADLSRVRFGVAVRGYRMGDVDAVLDRLATELDARDARLAALEGSSTAVPDAPSAGAPTGTAPPWPGSTGEPWTSDDGQAAHEVPAPPAVPPLPVPGGPATGPLTVAPAAWEDPYAAPARADGEPEAVEDAQAPFPEDTDTGAAGGDPGWWGHTADTAGPDDDASESPGWWGDDGTSEGPEGDEPADRPTDEPTDEWRALYDELRPAEPAPRERGEGPRRIAGPWDRAAGERDDEGGPWPSSW